MIYKKNKVIFLHIYKIAGKSIKNSLLENQDKNLLSNKIYNNTFGYLGYKKKYLPHQSIEIKRNGELLHSHIRAADYRDYLGHEFDDYFTFTSDLDAHGDTIAIPDRFVPVILDGATAFVYQYRGDAQQYTLNFNRFEQGIKNMQSLLANRMDYMRSTAIIRPKATFNLAAVGSG